MKHSIYITTPLFLTLFPVFSLWAENAGELSLASALALSFLAIVVASFLLLIARFVYRTWIKASLGVSIASLLFFSFGHIYDGLYAIGADFVRYSHLLIVWIALFIISSFFLFKTERNLDSLLRTFFATGLLLVLFPLVSLATNLKPFQSVDQKYLEVKEEIELASPQPSPDVYYIVLDQYASNWTLKNFYDYDNAHFTDFLKERGFIVDEKSLSNYAVTAFTLRSALNMDYFQNVQVSDPQAQIKDHLVGRLFKKLGYAYIHFGSEWEITAHNPYADKNINKGSLSESLMTIYRKTALYPVAYATGLDSWLTRRTQWRRILYQFEELGKIADTPGPTFTFVHFGVPHAPFVFNRDGSLRENDPEPRSGWIHDPETYLDQLVFVNEKIKEVVDTLVTRSEIPPIIILQSDHGSKSFSIEHARFVDEISDDALRNHFRNFSAYYIPASSRSSFYSGLTPVNVFRAIFNDYFGGDFEMLPDTQYMSINENEKEFTVVTPRVVY